jgi:hypothetical protein
MVAPDPAPGQSDAAPAAGGRGLVSRILPPAIRLWLHAQLDHLEDLDFRIEGRDRQILSGHLPQVSLSASQAVYQGLQVSRAEVRAEEVYLNLGQVIRGKALRLLQPFPVRGLVYLTREDLRASLQAPLLAQGLGEVLGQLGQSLPPASAVRDLTLAEGWLGVTWGDVEASAQQLRLETGLSLREQRWLALDQPTVTTGQPGQWSPPQVLANLTLDLGPATAIDHFSVTPDHIEIGGMVRVIPADA